MNDTSQPAEVVPATEPAQASEGDNIAVAPPQPPRSLPQASLWWWCFLIGAATAAYIAVGMRYLETLSGYGVTTQTIGLAVSLGGMAVGAVICARWTRRISALFLCYAMVAVVSALLGVFFHEIFTGVSRLADKLSPHGGVLFAAVFLLSALSGASAVCVVNGVLRLREASAVDVYMSAFAFYMSGAALALSAVYLSLLPAIGLVGAMVVAAMLQAALALAVWISGHRLTAPGALPEREESSPRSSPSAPLLFLIAAVFAAAAAYLFAWARLWTVFLGDTPVAVALPLSVFIAGLAAGGFWYCYKWASREGEAGSSALVLLVMGAIMALSPLTYPEFYDIIRDSYAVGVRDDAHWERVIVLNLLNCAIIIFPVGVCAALAVGMVFRTAWLVRGEATVAWMYAAQLVGVIVGAALAAHVLLPLADISLTLILAGALVMALSIVLYGFAARRRAVPAFSFTVILLSAVYLFGSINPASTSLSLMYGTRAAETVNIFAATGKNHNVGVDEWTDDAEYTLRGLIANGAHRAKMYFRPLSDLPNFTADEMAMVLTGVYPLLYKPDAGRVMNIGLHSPLTARTLLLSPRMQQVDNVGAEEKTLDALRQMGARVAPVLEDPRNVFVFRNARHVLARAERRYDAIIANTDDVWRRANQGQLTREFYRLAHDALVDDGVFVQRFAMSEVGAPLVSSAAQAMAAVFPAYKVYVAANRYIVFVATPAARLPAPADGIFADDAARQFLQAYRLFSGEDVEADLIGDRKQMEPYFASFSAPINSDYQPFIEGESAFSRFSLNRYYSLASLPLFIVPVMELQDHAGFLPMDANIVDAPYSHWRTGALQAAQIYQTREDENGALRQALRTMATRTCPTEESDDARLLEDVSTLMSALMPYIDAPRAEDIWRLLASDSCIAELLANDDRVTALYMQFWRALSLRDIPEVARLGDILRFNSDPSAPSGQLIMIATIWANYRLQNYPQVIALLNELPLGSLQLQHLGQFIGAHAAAGIE